MPLWKSNYDKIVHTIVTGEPFIETYLYAIKAADMTSTESSATMTNNEASLKENLSTRTPAKVGPMKAPKAKADVHSPEMRA